MSKKSSYSYTAKKRTATKTTVIGILLTFPTLGLIFGSIYAINLNPEIFSKLSGYLSDFFGGAGSYTGSGGTAFFECAVKYGKTILALWILAFTPPGLVAASFLLFAKGMSLGFSSAFMIKMQGSEGIYNSILLLLLQNIVLVPSGLYVAASGIAYAAGKYMGKANIRANRQKKPKLLSVAAKIDSLSLTEYFTVLLIGMACVILASMLEVYLLPYLINFSST